jgi:energy-coupling factor transporter transmembrane protein EcfT
MLRTTLLWLAAFFTLVLAVVLANQILQLSAFAAAIHPTFGQGVFWALVFVLALSFGVPLFLFLRLPRALRPPETEEGPEFERHLDDLRKRLGKNPRLKGVALTTREDMEAALQMLDAEATERARAAGSRAFITTAISQNGALDALVVLGLQARLIWDVARIYSQRPALGEMTYLYSNVMATAFITSEIDDAEIAEAMEPALSAVLGSAAGLVPGLQVASGIFVNSVLSGTANAFMTLRVGVIAIEYSRAWTRPNRRTLRKTAIVQAGGLLGGIVVSGAAKVSAALGRGLGKAATGAVSGTGRAVKGVVTGTGEQLGKVGRGLRDALGLGPLVEPGAGPGPMPDPVPEPDPGPGDGEEDGG